MSIKDWPASERPREKLLQLGPGALSDAELLAIFLRTGISGKSAVDLAREQLSHFGSLRALLAADLNAFCRAEGLGPAKFTQLQAVVEMARRHLAENLSERCVLSSPSGQTLPHRPAAPPPRRGVRLFVLDNQNRLIVFETLFQGTIDGASVYPREVVRRVLAHNAAAVIFAHNHPSGVAEPSRADHAITQRLKDALALIDVRVLDHLIIGEQEPLSLQSRGWI